MNNDVNNPSYVNSASAFVANCANRVNKGIHNVTDSKIGQTVKQHFKDHDQAYTILGYVLASIAVVSLILMVTKSVFMSPAEVRPPLGLMDDDDDDMHGYISSIGNEDRYHDCLRIIHEFKKGWYCDKADSMERVLKFRDP